MAVLYFFFSARGGEGGSEAPGGGGVGFFCLEIPGGGRVYKGGLPGREGPGGCLRKIGKYFFRGRNVHQENVFCQCPEMGPKEGKKWILSHVEPRFKPKTHLFTYFGPISGH